MNRIRFSFYRSPRQWLSSSKRSFRKQISSGTMILAFIFFSLSTSIYAAALPVTATAENSSLIFRVNHDLGYTTGSFGGYTAVVEKGESDQILSVKVLVNTQSINTRNEFRDEGLRSDLFLDSQKFPQATFESGAVHGNEVQGTLTLKGVTRPMTVKVAKTSSGQLVLTGEFNRADFGITYNKNLADKKKSIGEVIEIVLEFRS